MSHGQFSLKGSVFNFFSQRGFLFPCCSSHAKRKCLVKVLFETFCARMLSFFFMALSVSQTLLNILSKTKMYVQETHNQSRHQHRHNSESVQNFCSFIEHNVVSKLYKKNKIIINSFFYIIQLYNI